MKTSIFSHCNWIVKKIDEIGIPTNNSTYFLTGVYVYKHDIFLQNFARYIKFNYIIILSAV